MPTKLTHLTDAELAEFDALLDAKIAEADADLQLLVAALDAEPTGKPEAAIVDQRLLSDSAQPITRRDCKQLTARQAKFISHLRDAKARIANGTYGICRVTGRPISKERLRLVPHATLSLEAPKASTRHADRKPA